MLVGAVSVGNSFQAVSRGAGKGVSGHFPHTLSAFTLRPGKKALLFPFERIEPLVLGTARTLSSIARSLGTSLALHGHCSFLRVCC